MDRKLLVKRLEIVIGVFLIVVVVLGILVLVFGSIPAIQAPLSDTNESLLPGIPTDPNEQVKFLDITGQKEFTIANKKASLPGDDIVNSAYNNTSLTEFVCKNDTSSDCTIYEIADSGTTFYMAAPIELKLKEPTSSASVKKKLVISGEEVELTYTQRKFYNSETNDNGEIISTTEDTSLTSIEEIYGCLSSNICFNSGRLPNEKSTNDTAVAAFEQFVQAVVIR
ncbi:MAG: hypothetical protein ACMG57_05680 [Candidatus Dojkabacteria bacterium]